MFGIICVIGNPHRDGRAGGVGPSLAALRAARDVMASRGPDAAGEERIDSPTVGSVWLGHRRLSILDLSEAGRQPMWSDCGRYVITYNGEVYNSPALRTELRTRGRRFLSSTDTEVIVNEIYDHLDSTDTLLEAVRRAIGELEGAYALGVVSISEPGTIIACRKGSPLVIGVGIGECFIASDVSALAAVTQQFFEEVGSTPGRIEVDESGTAGATGDGGQRGGHQVGEQFAIEPGYVGTGAGHDQHAATAGGEFAGNAHQR